MKKRMNILLCSDPKTEIMVSENASMALDDYIAKSKIGKGGRGGNGGRGRSRGRFLIIFFVGEILRVFWCSFFCFSNSRVNSYRT